MLLLPAWQKSKWDAKDRSELLGLVRYSNNMEKYFYGRMQTDLSEIWSRHSLPEAAGRTIFLNALGYRCRGSSLVLEPFGLVLVSGVAYLRPRLYGGCTP